MGSGGFWGICLGYVRGMFWAVEAAAENPSEIGPRGERVRKRWFVGPPRAPSLEAKSEVFLFCDGF